MPLSPTAPLRLVTQNGQQVIIRDAKPASSSLVPAMSAASWGYAERTPPPPPQQWLVFLLYSISRNSRPGILAMTARGAS